MAFIAVLLLLWMIGMAARLFYLQVLASKPVRHTATVTLPAPRGMIYDCFNKELPLALNLPAWDLAVDYKALPEGTNRTHAAEALAEVTGKDVDEVLDIFRKACERRNRGFPLARTLDFRAVSLVDRGSVDEIPVRSFISKTDTYVRSYPQNERLAQVIGYVDVDGNGAMGIERMYDSYLRGAPGSRQIVRNAMGAEVRELRGVAIDPTPGADIHLTVDSRIQFVVERELRAAMEEFRSTAAWAVIQRVRTGEILAIASMPDFDLNSYAEYRSDDPCRRCYPVAAMYEPGSTMKTLTISGAINAGVVTPDTIVDAEKGAWLYGGFVLHDHPTGPISVATVIQKSSNIGTAKIALMMGNKNLEGYLRAMGIGSRVDIDLPGEARGMLDDSRRWDKVRPTRVAIGQGVAVTALQMVGAYATIANGGVMMQQYVVDRIVAADGTILLRNEPREKGHPLRASTTEKMTSMLQLVTQTGGTASRAKLPGYNVAGKTGTAQIPINGHYSSTDYWATFAGFVPAERPEIAMVVVVEKPHPENGAHTGGAVAAPVFVRIAEDVLRYLGVAPSEPISDAQ